MTLMTMVNKLRAKGLGGEPLSWRETFLLYSLVGGAWAIYFLLCPLLVVWCWRIMYDDERMESVFDLGFSLVIWAVLLLPWS